MQLRESIASCVLKVRFFCVKDVQHRIINPQPRCTHSFLFNQKEEEQTQVSLSSITYCFVKMTTSVSSAAASDTEKGSAEESARQGT